MIRLVITDLDNTLYNWVDYFVPSFNAMLEELVRLTGRDDATLRQSFQRVYEKHGTTEYSFAIQELDVLAADHAGLSVRDILAKYNAALKAFRRTRKKTLHLYDGVAPALEALRRSGKVIAAHTDAMMFYAEARLRQLRIEELFDILVAPQDHGLPAGTRLEDVRFHRESRAYEARVPLKRALAPGTVKPNPACLLEIIRTVGARPQEVLYVGDNLHRDISMAQICGVHDVHAAYGSSFDPVHYDQLLQITHRSPLARTREAASENVTPTFSINSFPELLRIITMIDSTACEPSHNP